MDELLIERTAPGTLETTGDGWTVEGLAVPYDRLQRVTDDGRTYYREAFTSGAFSRDCAKGGRWVNLMLGHNGDDGDRFLGRCVELRETPEGLRAAFRLNRDHPQAEAARSGELTGWSISSRVYRSRRERARNGAEAIVWRELCGLSHVAATASPQYEGAGVLVAREHLVVTGESSTPTLDAVRAWLDAHPHP